MEKLEIKFRAWNGTNMEYNIIAGWLGGYYVQGIDPKDTACLSPFNTKLTDSTYVMQYTGLKDKNGKEVWESDILKGPNSELAVVERHIKQPSFLIAKYLKTDIRKYSWDELFSPMQFEVIGDIYQNPELLK